MKGAYYYYHYCYNHYYCFGKSVSQAVPARPSGKDPHLVAWDRARASVNPNRLLCDIPQSLQLSQVRLQPIPFQFAVTDHAISVGCWQLASKGRFTYSMPCPCRAAKGLECVFPIRFTQCCRVWFTLAMPCPCHALTMPFFSRPRHSTSIERRPVGYLSAFGFFRLPRGAPRRLLSKAYQSHMQVASVKPNKVCHGRGKEW